MTILPPESAEARNELITEDDALFPASAWQSAYWRKAHGALRGSTLNVGLRWRIDGTISDAAVEHAMNVLSARHEILRTRLLETTEGVFQKIEASRSIRVAFIDLQRLDAERQQSELARIGREEARAPFDLGACGFLRVLFVRTSNDSAVLHWTTHHLVADGWSIGILAREFCEIAAAYDLNRTHSLADVDLHYADYVLWQREMLASGQFNEDLHFWMDTLDGLPAFQVPGDVAEGGVPGQDDFIRSQLLPAEIAKGLELRAAQCGQSLFCQAVTGLSAALYAITAANEVVLGTEVAARTDLDSESIVGPVLNAILLRVPVSREASLSALARSVFERSQAAMGHQGLPFAILEEKCAGHDGGGALDYKVNFVLQRAFVDTDQKSGIRTERFVLHSLPSHTSGAQWDLNFFMVEREEGWRISCEAKGDRYSPDLIDAMLTRWKEGLAALALNDGVALRDLYKQVDAKVIEAPDAPILRTKLTDGAPLSNERRKRLLDRVITLRGNGALTPVFAMNITSMFFPVVEALERDRPFYDLRLQPSDTPVNLPARHFKDLARDAVETIRAVRPHGPYILFGFCVCGAIALEVAQQLRDEGEEVPLVVLNDTWRPGYREDMNFVDRQRRIWKARIASWRRDWQLMRSGDQSFAYTLNKYPMVRLILADTLRIPKIAAHFGWTKDVTTADLGIDEGRWYAEYLAKAQASYRPQPYGGRIVIFRSEEVLTGDLFAHDFGWGEYTTGPLEVISCPGEHATMFRAAGARVIGDKMRAVLSAMSR